jgi:steroid 5-alpha reductase family enzyme
LIAQRTGERKQDFKYKALITTSDKSPKALVELIEFLGIQNVAIIHVIEGIKKCEMP